MNIHMHIERMIIEGVDLPPAQRHLLQAAVEAELGRLLAAREISTNFKNVGSQVGIVAPVLQLNSSPDAKVLGAQVGASVYSAITGSEQPEKTHGPG